MADSELCAYGKVIEELIGLARDMRAAQACGEALKLTDDEVAF